MPSARKLIERINELKLSPVARAVERRIEEFKSFPQRPEEDWFSELCFCILTANSSAELGIRIQREIGAEGFLRLPEEELALKLKPFGHRFYLRRARFIVEARRHRGIKGVVQSFLDPKACRDWIVKRVKGVGL
ncbi:TPA: N-glycosylase, partial [Candidatus Bathyarchaeota archaeon]|nr:N-glycosylase [Candidatus Bathyarchaeota archaeon]